MTTYRRFIENNEWEAETWNFWLQVDGNMTGLAILGDVLDKLIADTGEPPEFALTDDQLDESEVDILIKYSDATTCMDQHNKVNGSLRLSKGIGDFDYDRLRKRLYKGGIKDFFTAGGAE